MIRALLRRRRLKLGEMPPIPIIGAADARWSVISSAHDLYVQPNDDLVGVALRAAETARSVKLADLETRSVEPDLTWIRTWPGEHYRFLAALARTTDARRIVEIGTFKGQGALALSAGAPADARVVTYDILPWSDFSDSALRQSDF